MTSWHEEQLRYFLPNIEGTFRYWLPKSERQKAGFQKAIALLETAGYLS